MGLVAASASASASAGGAQKLIFDPTLADERRAELFNYLNLEAAEKYAWCVPDERALKVLAHFAPIVEIGAGKGYWYVGRCHP